MEVKFHGNLACDFSFLSPFLKHLVLLELKHWCSVSAWEFRKLFQNVWLKFSPKMKKEGELVAVFDFVVSRRTGKKSPFVGLNS